MSKPKLTTEDEKSFADYIGSGEAHRKPPAKKMKFTENAAEKSSRKNEKETKETTKSLDTLVDIEPKSKDVFVSSQESDNDDYETCQETLGEEEEEERDENDDEMGDGTMVQEESKGEEKEENEDEVVADSQKKEEENEQLEEENQRPIITGDNSPKFVDSDEHSMEIDEDTSNDEPPKQQPERPVTRKQIAPKLNKSESMASVASCCSNSSDERCLEEMSRSIVEENQTKEKSSQDPFDDLQQNNDSNRRKSSSTDDNNTSYKTAPPQLSPEITNNTSLFNRPSESEPSFHYMEVDEALEQTALEDGLGDKYLKQRQLEEEAMEQEEPVETKKNDESPKKEILNKIKEVSLEPQTPIKGNSSFQSDRRSISSVNTTKSSSSTPRKGGSYQTEMVNQLTAFRNGKLVFQPDFAKCDGTKNYRYCKIPGLEDQKHFYRWNSPDREGRVVMPQRWTQMDAWDRPNREYHKLKKLLQDWMREYKYGMFSGGYQLFEGLIHDMMDHRGSYVRMPALAKYYRETSRRLGSEQDVMNQFMRLVKHAQSAESILPKRIYRLVGDVESATFSHAQCAALVARMFFSKSTYYGFYDILTSHDDLAVEKLKFLFTYFDKMSLSPPEGVVSFRRVQMKVETFNNKYSERRLFQLPIVRFIDPMTIEETTLSTQVDFANRHLGGGVLAKGAVQEEIRFLMCPEMMVGMLLTEQMGAMEAISIVGAHVFSSYTGYSMTVKWMPLETRHSRSNPNEFRDAYGRLRTETIAIDAIRYTGSGRRCFRTQMDTSNLLREIKKATVGFSSQSAQNFDKIPVVSGWWGCGAFNGNKSLKFLIQLLACGIANRPLQFSAFGDKEMAENCRKIYERMRKEEVKIGGLWTLLKHMPDPTTFTELYPFDYISQKLISLKAAENEANKSKSSTSSTVPSPASK